MLYFFIIILDYLFFLLLLLYFYEIFTLIYDSFSDKHGLINMENYCANFLEINFSFLAKDVKTLSKWKKSSIEKIVEYICEKETTAPCCQYHTQ